MIQMLQDEQLIFIWCSDALSFVNPNNLASIAGGETNYKIIYARED